MRLARPGPRWIVRGLALGGLALVEVLLLAWLVVVLGLALVGVAVFLVPAAFALFRRGAHRQRWLMVLLGVGVYLVPSALAGVHGVARRQRALAGRWSGIVVPAPPRPAVRGRGFRAAWQACVAALRDRSTWSELLWLLVDPFVGLTLAWLPLSLLLYGVWGVVLCFLWDPVLSGMGDTWYLWLHVRDGMAAMTALRLGLVLVVLAPLVARPLVRLHARWVRAVLGTGYRRLAERAAELERSRSDAVEQAWSEIRRIERDLHDGAQARLVAVGMTLTAAERTLGSDPEAALALVRDAKEASVAALAELRDLVRGVYPPVLADRGLVDALRAKALGMAVPTSLRSTLDVRPAPPVESAVYFAVCELLANVTKHAGATRVDVSVGVRDRVLTVQVRDDGVGGADPTRGTGLAGVARRLAVFDGTLDVDSPPGGPTAMTVAVR